RSIATKKKRNLKRSDASTMQKNLLIKTGIIIATLLVFLYGMLGIPKGFGKDALKAAIADRIHLGLDLKGGTHLILAVQVNDAVKEQSDHAVEALKEELQKANVAYADISKPDPANQPEKVVIKGVPLDASSKVRTAVNDRLPDFDVTAGADNTWNV